MQRCSYFECNVAFRKDTSCIPNALHWINRKSRREWHGKGKVGRMDDMVGRMGQGPYGVIGRNRILVEVWYMVIRGNRAGNSFMGSF